VAEPGPRHRPAILILQPEGTFPFNASLLGITDVLAGAGYRVGIAARRREFPQGLPGSPAEVRLYPALLERLLAHALGRDGRERVAGRLLRYLRVLPRADLYLGVDREGILLARFLADATGSRHALVSYEIMFEHETSPAFKAPEIRACQGLAFATAPDGLRAEKLSRENRIPRDRIIEVPVAGRGVRSGRRGALRAKLGIPARTRIALYMGSFTAWAMVDELVDSTRRWPPEWCLVVHNRLGFTPDQVRDVERRGCPKVFLSGEALGPVEGLGLLLGDADLGVGLYRPTYATPFVGDNLRYLGLASGKIATYLQYGVPVLTNGVGLYDGLMAGRRIGITVSSPDEVPAALERAPVRDIETERRCHAFFREYLDLEGRAPVLLEAIRRGLLPRAGAAKRAAQSHLPAVKVLTRPLERPTGRANGSDP
jgi:hypothetical protein